MTRKRSYITSDCIGTLECSDCGGPIAEAPDGTLIHIKYTSQNYAYLYEEEDGGENFLPDPDADASHQVAFTDRLAARNDPRYISGYRVGNVVRWNGNCGKIIKIDKDGYYGVAVHVRFDDGTVMRTTPSLDPAWGKGDNTPSARKPQRPSTDMGHCPSCGNPGVLEAGCPNCPGFWFE